MKLDGPITLSSIKAIRSAFGKDTTFGGTQSPKEILKASKLYGYKTNRELISQELGYLSTMGNLDEARSVRNKLSEVVSDLPKVEKWPCS
jgi:uncharacterized membrane protein